MFAKRKNSDGFEWHKYVRTTIKLRREQRKEKVREAGRAAGEQVGAAGVALLAGSKAAGAAIWDGARAGVGGLWLLVLAVYNIFLIAALHAADKSGLALLGASRLTRRVARPVAAVLSRPPVGATAALLCALAAGAAVSRYRMAGFDREAMWTTIAAGLLLLTALPMLTRLAGLSLPRLPAVPFNPRIVGGLLLVAVVAAGAFALVRHAPAKFGLASMTAHLPTFGSGASAWQGRAQAIAGDRLRIGSATVRLSGIEVPEPTQLCGTPGTRQFRCGGLATNALNRIVGGAILKCSADGTDARGTPYARCQRGDKEINAEMVRQGQAFAEGGLVLTRYGSEEKEARAAKAGVWAAGDSLRPAEWRTKLWDDAKKRAPEGCPIKGTIAAGQKIYLLPWSPDYDRGRIQAARGERWFCSEGDAASAGFKPAAG